MQLRFLFYFFFLCYLAIACRALSADTNQGPLSARTVGSGGPVLSRVLRAAHNQPLAVSRYLALRHSMLAITPVSLGFRVPTSPTNTMSCCGIIDLQFKLSFFFSQPAGG